jgi:hypothetical protein
MCGRLSLFSSGNALKSNNKQIHHSDISIPQFFKVRTSCSLVSKKKKRDTEALINCAFFLVI